MTTDSPVPSLIYYNGLLMHYQGINILFSNDNGQITGWLSKYESPLELSGQDCTYALVFHRAGELDLIVVNNYLTQSAKTLTVQVWLNFIQHENDLRELGRPYNDDSVDFYQGIWDSINQQIQALLEQHGLPPVVFSSIAGSQYKPHFRYA